MTSHIDDLLRWRDETRRLDDAIWRKDEQIRELKAVSAELYRCCAELLSEYEGCGYCPSEALIADTEAAMARARGESSDAPD